jgi:hypothetical protein
MAGIFGNGSDGDVTISSNTTLVRDMCYNNLTVNSGITLDSGGFRIRVASTLLNNGIISSSLIGVGGIGGIGGTGGNSGSNGQPGGDGSPSATDGNGSGGGGGGGGGAVDMLKRDGRKGGDGGNGGRKRNNLFIYAYILNNIGVITSSGENGENGENGPDSPFAECGGGGGGGGGDGGNGGNLTVLYNTLLNLGSLLYFGGTGGNGGTGGWSGAQNRVGGVGGNGIYGKGGNPGYDGSSRGGGGGGGSAGSSYYYPLNGGAGASGADGKDGLHSLVQTSTSYDWNLILTDYNFASVWNNTDILTGYRCGELHYYGSDNCEIYKIVDFGKNVAGLIFNIDGYIKITSYVASANVNFKYEWLDSTGSLISSNSIATLTANQEYTKSYVENIIAPTGAYKIKIRFYCSGSGSVKTYLGSFSIKEVVKYGLKIKDGSNINVLTPEIGTIISCGTATMPNSLNGDGTYGLDIDLPGTASIPVSKIGVFLLPHGNITWEAFGKGLGWASGDPSNSMRYIPSCFVDDDYTYYTKDSTTGVMSVFTPGTHTDSTPGTWDGIISIFPVVGWDRVGENLTSVRLWAATCYIIVDGLSELKAIYSIGNTGGITSVDYAIFLKEWNF